jgi:hypothetical protein
VNPNVSNYPSSVLFTAVQLSDVVAAKLFLEFGANPNYAYEDKVTCLLQAARVLKDRAFMKTYVTVANVCVLNFKTYEVVIFRRVLCNYELL